MKKRNEKEEFWADALLKRYHPHGEGKEIPLSLILPVYNCAERIAGSLDSIQRQNYLALEVIVIDAGSTDHTLEIVNSYRPLISRIYSVTEYDLFDMLNRGLLLASGKYLTFLFPGSFYLSGLVFDTFAHSAVKNAFPELIYCAALQRESQREPRLVYAPFQRDVLAKSIQPAVLPACWFRSDVFEKLGKFQRRLPVRGGFEYLCRFSGEKEMHSVAIDRVYVDFDYGSFSYKKFLNYISDNWRVLFTHFGFWRAFIWFLGVNHLTVVKWLWRSWRRRI